MSNVVRPPKTAGTNQYQTEVANNAIAILDTEVDDDFNTIYHMVNGNLDDANISGVPTRIAKSKLNLDGAIGPGDIAPGTIDGGGPIIQDGTITSAKIKTGNTTFGLGQFSDETGMSVDTTEKLLAEVVWSPGRNGFYLAVGRVSGVIDANANENATIYINLKSGGNPGDVTGTLIERSIQRVGNVLDPGHGISIPWSVTLIGVGLANTSHRIKLTGNTTVPIAVGFGCGINTRALRAWELA